MKTKEEIEVKILKLKEQITMMEENIGFLKQNITFAQESISSLVWVLAGETEVISTEELKKRFEKYNDGLGTRLTQFPKRTPHSFPPDKDEQQERVNEDFDELLKTCTAPDTKPFDQFTKIGTTVDGKELSEMVTKEESKLVTSKIPEKKENHITPEMVDNATWTMLEGWINEYNLDIITTASMTKTFVKNKVKIALHSRNLLFVNDKVEEEIPIPSPKKTKPLKTTLTWQNLQTMERGQLIDVIDRYGLDIEISDFMPNTRETSFHLSQAIADELDIDIPKQNK